MVTTSAVSATGAQSTPTSQTKSGGFSGGDFETFLKMLTTQIRNQDPLNPMEGSEFAVQLATFSGVEQQVKTNDLLEQMSGQLGANSLSTYSDWIGRQVRTTGQIFFGDNPLIMDISPDPAADRVVLVTKDSYGRRISAEEVGKGDGLVEWYGVDTNGARLPLGFTAFHWKAIAGTRWSNKETCQHIARCTKSSAAMAKSHSYSMAEQPQISIKLMHWQYRAINEMCRKRMQHGFRLRIHSQYMTIAGMGEGDRKTLGQWS